VEALRTAVVGCGKVGHLHAKALSRLPESMFVAVCSGHFQRAQQFAAEYNVKAYHDVEEMIAGSGVQSLNICTPHPLHAAPAIKAANSGVHVLVEKPLASSLADCDAIIEAGKRAG
jgi:predicted dehydrogenase